MGGNDVGEEEKYTLVAMYGVLVFRLYERSAVFGKSGAKRNRVCVSCLFASQS